MVDKIGNTQVINVKERYVTNTGCSAMPSFPYLYDGASVSLVQDSFLVACTTDTIEGSINTAPTSKIIPKYYATNKGNRKKFSPA